VDEPVHLGLYGVSETACGRPLPGGTEYAVAIGLAWPHDPTRATWHTSDHRRVTCETCKVTPSAGPGWTPPMLKEDGERVREAVPPQEPEAGRG
jgi:hypothetical protein